VRIEQRRIILEKDGRLEALEVVQKEPRRNSRGRANAARNADRSRERGAQRMVESMRRFNDASSMGSSQTPITIDASPDGYFTGVQVQQVSGLAEFGIEPGDRIMTVDGVQLNDPSVVPGVLQSLGRGQPKVVGIDRNGSNVEVEIPAERILDVLRALRLTP
jgi:type II secretory pathway component PulC